MTRLMVWNLWQLWMTRASLRVALRPLVTLVGTVLSGYVPI